MTVSRGNTVNVDWTPNENASTASLTCTLPSAMAAGKLLVAHVVASTSSPGLPGTGGWQWASGSPLGTNNEVLTGLAYTTDPAAGLAFTQATAGRMTVILTVYSGEDPLTVVDVTPTTNNVITQSMTLTGITTVTAGDMLVSGCGINASTITTITPPSGFTLVARNTSNVGKGGGYADLGQAAAGATGNEIWTNDAVAGTRQCGYLAAIRAAVVGADPNPIWTPGFMTGAGFPPFLLRNYRANAAYDAGAVASATVDGTAGITGAGALTATTTQEATASPAGAGTLSATATQVIGASLAAAGALSAVVTQQATATLTGAGTLTATAAGAVNGTASITGAGTLSATVVQRAGASPAGAGAVTAAGVIRGTAILAGSGALAAAVRQQATAALVGAGMVNASAGFTLTGTASLAGAGAVVANGRTKYTTRPNTGTTAQPAGAPATTSRPFTTMTNRPAGTPAITARPVGTPPVTSRP